MDLIVTMPESTASESSLWPFRCKKGLMCSKLTKDSVWWTFTARFVAILAAPSSRPAQRSTAKTKEFYLTSGWRHDSMDGGVEESPTRERVHPDGHKVRSSGIAGNSRCGRDVCPGHLPFLAHVS